MQRGALALGRKHKFDLGSPDAAQPHPWHTVPQAVAESLEDLGRDGRADLATQDSEAVDADDGHERPGAISVQARQQPGLRTGSAGVMRRVREKLGHPVEGVRAGGSVGTGRQAMGQVAGRQALKRDRHRGRAGVRFQALFALVGGPRDHAARTRPIC